TGDVYRAAFDRLVLPAAEEFAPTWLIVSAGFDAHRDDPITDMSLSAVDYGSMMSRLLPLVEPGRVLVMLEGGYDLEALSASTASTLAALVGMSPSAGGAMSTDAPTSSWTRLDEIVEFWARLDG
ncbi:MAG: histone deacetylase, partial [Actinomycetota bacterium]